MTTGGDRGLAKERKRLMTMFERLDPGRRATLSAFAEFLHAQLPPAAPIAAPRPISRPDEESVVAAIRRLRETYPAVDTKQLFDDVADCMSGHLLRGRPAAEVIDELETLFGNAHKQAIATQEDA